MFDKADYDRLQSEKQQIRQEINQAKSESKAEQKQLISQTKSAIDSVTEQVNDPTVLQHKLHEILDTHTQQLVELISKNSAYRERLHHKLSDVFRQIDRHRNQSFIWSFAHFTDEDKHYGYQIHWDIYFRHDKFNEHSRVFFLKPDESTWTYDNGTEGFIEQLEKHSLIVGYHTFKWLEGYDVDNDTLIFKLL